MRGKSHTRFTYYSFTISFSPLNKWIFCFYFMERLFLSHQFPSQHGKRVHINFAVISEIWKNNQRKAKTNVDWIFTTCSSSSFQAPYRLECYKKRRVCLFSYFVYLCLFFFYPMPVEASQVHSDLRPTKKYNRFWLRWIKKYANNKQGTYSSRCGQKSDSLQLTLALCDTLKQRKQCKTMLS